MHLLAILQTQLGARQGGAKSLGGALWFVEEAHGHDRSPLEAHVRSRFPASCLAPPPLRPLHQLRRASSPGQGLDSIHASPWSSSPSGEDTRGPGNVAATPTRRTGRTPRSACSTAESLLTSHRSAALNHAHPTPSPPPAPRLAGEASESEAASCPAAGLDPAAIGNGPHRMSNPQRRGSGARPTNQPPARKMWRQAGGPLVRYSLRQSILGPGSLPEAAGSAS